MKPENTATEHLPAQAPGHLGGQPNPALGSEEKMQQEEKITLVLCLSAFFYFFFFSKIAGLFLGNCKNCLWYFCRDFGDGGFPAQKKDAQAPKNQ